MKGAWEEADQARDALRPVGKIRRNLHFWVAAGLGVGVLVGFGFQGLLTRVDAHPVNQPAPEDNPVVLGQEPSLTGLKHELVRQQLAQAAPEPVVEPPVRAQGDAQAVALQQVEEQKKAALVASSPMLAIGWGTQAVPAPVPALGQHSGSGSATATGVGAGLQNGMHRLAHSVTDNTVSGASQSGMGSPMGSSLGALTGAELPAAAQSLMGRLPPGLSPVPAGLGGGQNGAEAGARAGGNNAPPDKSPLTPVKPASIYQVLEGSLMPAVLLTQINSDLPGMLTAQVTEDVYDSIHGSFLAIPKGSRVIGAYGAHVVAGQERIMASFHRLILPSGESFNLDDMQAADRSGQSGLKDEVDNRFWTRLGGQFMTAGLARIIEQPGGGVMVMGGMGTSLMGDAAGQILVDSARAGFAANAAVGPVIIIKRGFPFVIMVNRDMDFSSLHP